jgi:predicted transglutaminase-like cysteine proteinase
MDSASRGIFSLAVVTAALVIAAGAHAGWLGSVYAFDDEDYLGESHLLPDWAETMARHESQAPVLEACLADEETCPSYYRGLRVVLLRAADLPEAKQVKLINRYVNRKRYRNDRTEHLETELSDEPVRYRSRWSTVEEFMRRGGDCEDFATTKYYLLRSLGIHADRLRVVVTWDKEARGYHAILAVRLDGEIQLLESDNQMRRGRRHPYRFIYSVNEESIWDHERRVISSKPQKDSDAPSLKENSV